jgi:uncharacterized phage-associated protein
MQLQKLVFLAQGYGIALLGHSIFYNNVHAWQWGPVVPKLYKPLQKYGSGLVTELLPDEGNPVPDNSDEMKVIFAVWKAFKDFDGFQLSGITHQEGTPWIKTWRNKQYAVIPNELIGEYYKGLLTHAN